MAETDWTEGDALEALLPHRGMNVLIDAVRVEGRGRGARGLGRLNVAPDDARGRDIFLRESEAGGRVFIEPALAEHAAICGICVLKPDMAEGEIAFFSVISRFECPREAREGEDIRAEVERLRDRGPFRRFDVKVLGKGPSEDGGTVASMNILAYATVPEPADGGGGGPDGGSAEGKLLEPPRVTDVRPVDRGRFSWKRPEMVFIDEVVDTVIDEAAGEGADPERQGDGSGEATFRYTYPADHPFCAGHFPGNPVMMGIAEWIAACDAAAWLAAELGAAGPAPDGLQRSNGRRKGRWKADADIIRETGAAVADVRGLVFSLCIQGKGPEALGPVRVEKAKRVSFRGQVRPGETVFVRVKVAPLPG